MPWYVLNRLAEHLLALRATQEVAPVPLECGSLMLFLFSLGSAVGICATLVASLTKTGLSWASAPDAIALTVSVMLVLCMDVASLYASFKIRQLATRRSGAKAYILHSIVIVVASILESATFAYMSWLYDDPTIAIVAALILIRALAAPFFAIYLNSARAIPVGPRDILYQAELATGVGVLQDVVRIAADPSASLARKLELFRASARMSDEDRSQLDGMITVMGGRNVPGVVVDALDFAPARLRAGEPGDETADAATGALNTPRALQRVTEASSDTPTRPPTGPGSPKAARRAASGDEDASEGTETRGGLLQLVAPPEWRSTGRKAASGRYNARSVRTASAEDKARRAWDKGARTVGEIVLKSASDPAGRIGRSAASKYR